PTVDGGGPGGDVPEDGGQVEVLERAPAEHLGGHLAGDRDDRGLVELGVVQAGEQVGRTGAGDGEAGGRAAGQLAVGAGGERGRAFVADADVGELAAFLGAAHGLGEAEVGVPDHTEHVRHPVRDEGLDENVGGRARMRYERGDPD